MNLQLEAKLIAKLYIQQNGCWIYTGGHDGYGYGFLEHERTHVISFNCFKGCVPKGMYVCHSCDEPPCFNPDHLYLGTHYDNIQDMWKSGRGVMPDRVGSNNGAACLNEELVLEIRALYVTGNYTQAKLSEQFKVDHTTIWKVIHRKTWRHV